MSKPTLYYFPASFFSQKVLIALYEKEATFNSEVIQIHSGEQNEPLYIKINPKGTVPALVDGNKVLTDSEEIVEYLDRNIDTGIKLIPDPDSKVGQEVDKWRQLFNSVEVGVITYGVISHPELYLKEPRVPAKMRQQALPRMNNSITALKEKASRNQELSDTYNVKADKLSGMVSKMRDAAVVRERLDDLDKLFDQVEEKLVSTKKEQGIPDIWLVGPRFTMADINLVILLDRVYMLGLEDRFFPQTKRPLLFDYYTRMGQRRSVQNVRNGYKNIPKLILGLYLKRKLPVILGITALIGGIAFWRKWKS